MRTSVKKHPAGLYIQANTQENVTLQSKQQEPERDSLRSERNIEDRNKQIHSVVAIFLVVAVVVLLSAWAIEYSKTGAITLIGGGLGIVGLAILRNVHRLMSGYQYKWSLWKRMTVVMSVLFGILFCLASIGKCAKNIEPLYNDEIYQDTVADPVNKEILIRDTPVLQGFRDSLRNTIYDK